MNRLGKYMEIKSEILEAIDKDLPVVAIETSFISHGMPYPKNIETIMEIEKIIRDKGAIPASLAVINGSIKIGLTNEELMILAKDKSVIKMSTRDIPTIVAGKLTGSCTVSTSIVLCKMSGIKVLVTGCIGGVHKGAQNSFDISRDLQEISQSDICVVCTGADAVIDINLTLEYLETMGVAVLGYKTKEMPSFYYRQSGYELDFELDSPEKIGKIIKIKWDLGIEGGVIVANPVPNEYAIDKKIIDQYIDEAIWDANIRKIHGKEINPFLINKVIEATHGKSIETNIGLLKSNAYLAADIADEVYRVDY